jgi:hypothetical protein
VVPWGWLAGFWAGVAGVVGALALFLTSFEFIFVSCPLTDGLHDSSD